MAGIRRPLIVAVLLLVLAQLTAVFIGPRQPLLSRGEEDALPTQVLDPGEFAGTLLLAGFRGLAIDILWMRATAAKDAGRFYESVALFQLISKLQPQFETVWEYMAWDMAYNIPAEIESRAGKYAWFLAGIEAAVEGSRRNPRGGRLHRYLAWMMTHRGALFTNEVAAEDWRPLLAPLLDPLGIAVPPPGSSPQRLGAALYRMVIALAEEDPHYHMPAFTRRILPISLEQDGNLARNQGRHLQALLAYLDALEAWQETRSWAEEEAKRLQGLALDANTRRRHDQVWLTIESFERIEGQLRRKTAALAGLLAEEQAVGERFAEQIMQRHLSDARALIKSASWHQVAPQAARIVWYDEIAE